MSVPFVLLLKSIAGGAFALLALVMVGGPLLLGHAPTGVEQTAAAITGGVIGALLALKA